MAIHARLAEGLEHVFEQSAQHMSFDTAAAAKLVDRIRQGDRLAPVVFGDFFWLIDRIDNGSLDEVGEAIQAMLATDPDKAEALRIRPLSADLFTPPEEQAFRRQFVSDSLLDEQIEKLDAPAAREAGNLIQTALDLLRDHAPNSYAELETTISEIVPADGKLYEGIVFNGCSSIERWGAILINITLEKSPLVLAETLVHEASHTVLFGKSPVDFFVLNDNDERYASPLRLDPRPLDGIYHATFVLARMHYAMLEIASSSTASADLRRDARELAARSHGLFSDGHAVLDDKARYTERGGDIMRSAAAFMSSVAAEA